MRCCQRDDPVFPGKACVYTEILIKPAEARGSENEILSAFRKVRNEINQRIEEEFSRC